VVRLSPYSAIAYVSMALFQLFSWPARAILVSPGICS
jgi:hypothetical protein